MNFILAQIMGGIALVVLAISYFVKNRNTFLLLQIVCNIFYAVSFIFNGALTGGINTLISVLRLLVFYMFEKRNVRPPIHVLFIFFELYLVSGLFFANNLIDLITVVASIVATIAKNCSNLQTMRYLSLIPSSLNGVYGMLNKVYTSALMNFIEVIILIIAIIKFSFPRVKGHKKCRAK